MQYPERDVPLFGENITCDKVYAFFNRLEVHKDSQNCRLAQSVNYICGCEGTGYAGANTEAKQKSLVWMPRVSGILSLMVSIELLNINLSFHVIFGSLILFHHPLIRLRVRCSSFMIHCVLARSARKFQTR